MDAFREKAKKQTLTHEPTASEVPLLEHKLNQKKLLIQQQILDVMRCNVCILHSVSRMWLTCDSDV